MSRQTIHDQWRPIPGFESRYEASLDGRIRNVRSGRILRLSHNGHGYASVHLYEGHGIRHTVTVHRLVARTFLGEPTATLLRHLNGDKTDNSVSNLAYGSGTENNFDAVAHGTHYNARKTHCIHGHPFDVSNTRFENGWRRCRACEYSRKSAARHSSTVMA